MLYDDLSADGLDDGPSVEDLAAIEVEWPLIEAEVAVTDAEIRILTAVTPTEWDWRRLRHARRRVLRVAAVLAAQPAVTRPGLSKAA
jgi:hypothetical protein